MIHGGVAVAAMMSIFETLKHIVIVVILFISHKKMVFLI